MIHIYCSKKLQEFVGDVQMELPADCAQRSLGNWNGHLFFVDRKKCLIFVNNLTNYTLYMVDMLKKDMKHFEPLFYQRLEEQMRYEGIIANSEHFDKHFPREEIQFYKTNNDRRQTGCINDLVQTFKAHRLYKYENFEDMPVVYENSLMNTRLNRGSGEGRNTWKSSDDNMRKVMES